MTTEPLYDEVLRKAGGLPGLSSALGESKSTVSNWRDRGFPARHCKAIERLTGISVRRLRPTDWQDYWPSDQPARRPRARAAA